MHFHIQKAVQSDEGNDYDGYIYATARPSDSEDPILLDVRLKQEGENSTRVDIRSSSKSQKVSQVMANTVKSNIIMPKCNTCGQVYPMTLYDPIRKGQQVICEVCGTPARFPKKI